ncbi:subtilisin-like protease SBT1.5 [Dendrobium catenatum]|uniref:Subtilisin-like protease SDD1 n=1 Tax=Dendrobium catenatum TaxID=906689 RepID=A0A2I0WYN4_9ASPA|nr:subtilisin-like protease SBT1.5 [Dendrobium catenatum]PKU80772.1 Subtilisin-like protease SDD1 [Dendrobium catenatum]
MATLTLLILSFLITLTTPSLLNASLASSSQTDNPSIPQTYIILVKPQNFNFTTQAARDNWYASFLPNKTINFIKSRLLRTYSDAISGFVANLTVQELHQVERHPSFLTAIPNRNLRLLTTHTPAYLGLYPSQGFWNLTASFGAGIIIGMLDSGIHASHPSFSHDQAMPDPPPQWKGICEFNYTGACNKKLIGARSHTLWKDLKSPDDLFGHGTHTSATAAGAFIPGANLLGSANGTAAGLAPLAHLAMYRVCETVMFCSTDAILAGLDSAINDGVHIISLSLGGPSYPFYEDVIAIGAFKAIKKGILVSCAAGNDGPFDTTVGNAAPWLLTVGASTTDRNVRATVKLGNGEELDGQSAYQPKRYNASSLLPLVKGSNNKDVTMYCLPETLQSINVRGKAVLCFGDNSEALDTGIVVKKAGGAAMIFANIIQNGYTTMAEPHVLPASHIDYNSGVQILSYVNSTANPTASIIFKGSIFGVTPAPTVASFSSRGPSYRTPGILKPDIIAPGVSVLAAWPFKVRSESNRLTNMNFNMISGTSMATPHLSGIAALLKSVHRDWSAAAIKSAIMTTADTIGNDGEPIKNELHEPASFFDFGAGQVNPLKAADPGLVYDLTVDEYTSYLCGLGYTNAEVEVITGTNVSCDEIKKISEAELNYPSILVIVPSEGIEVRRVVTNVGEASSCYKVKLEMPEDLEVGVEPEMLQFTKVGEKQGFTVRIKAKSSGLTNAQGSLKWVSDKRVVRSSVIVSTK